MIRCTIEIIPGGREDHPRRRVVGVVQVVNIGGGEQVGNYSFKLDKSLFGKPKESFATGDVTNFPRKRLGPYDLLFRVLRAAVGDRNPK